jgi:hypothetical protein
MPTLERYLEALIALKSKAAEDSLIPNGPQVANAAYQFGFVCGVQQGLKMAEELLNTQLQEDAEDGDDSRTTKARRAR